MGWGVNSGCGKTAPCQRIVRSVEWTVPSPLRDLYTPLQLHLHLRLHIQVEAEFCCVFWRPRPLRLGEVQPQYDARDNRWAMAERRSMVWDDAEACHCCRFRRQVLPQVPGLLHAALLYWRALFPDNVVYRTRCCTWEPEPHIHWLVSRRVSPRDVRSCGDHRRILGAIAEWPELQVQWGTGTCLLFNS